MPAKTTKKSDCRTTVKRKKVKVTPTKVSRKKVIVTKKRK